MLNIDIDSIYILNIDIDIYIYTPDQEGWDTLWIWNVSHFMPILLAK